MKVPLVKMLSSSICLIAYTVPLLLAKNIGSYDYSFIDVFYAIGTTFGIGLYLIIDSYELNKIHEYYLISAGVFFIGLSAIFIIDTILDRMFRTYWYVIINLLITFICYILLTLRQRFIQD